MKIRLGELRRIIREALGEQGAPGDLAAWINDGEDKKAAVIYSPTELMNFSNTIDGVANPKSLAGDVVDVGIVKGYISIKKPDQPCNGAWEVKFSAGPGLGDILYAVGFALSPSGILMPDRKAVSQKARRRWEKEGGRAKKPLDDFEHPPVDPERNNLHDRHHTPDDPSDDCRMNKQDFDILNYSYQSTGGERGMLENMMHLHTETMRWFNDNSGHPSRDVERLLETSGVIMLGRFL